MKITVGMDNVIAWSSKRLLDVYNKTYNRNQTPEDFNPYDLERATGLDFKSCLSLVSRTWDGHEKIETVDGAPITIRTMTRLQDLGQVSIRATGVNGVVNQMEGWLKSMNIPYDRFDPIIIDPATWSSDGSPHNNADVIIDSNERAGYPGVPLLLRKAPWNQATKSPNTIPINAFEEAVPIVRRLSWELWR
jgi:hypothetical protein